MHIFLRVHSSGNVINKVFGQKGPTKVQKTGKTILSDCKGPYFSQFSNAKNLALRCSDVSVK